MLRLAAGSARVVILSLGFQWIVMTLRTAKAESEAVSAVVRVRSSGIQSRMTTQNPVPAAASREFGREVTYGEGVRP